MIWEERRHGGCLVSALLSHMQQRENWGLVLAVHPHLVLEMEMIDHWRALPPCCLSDMMSVVGLSWKMFSGENVENVGTRAVQLNKWF